MNIPNRLQTLALIVFAVFLYSSTLLCAASAAPAELAYHNVCWYNTTHLPLDITYQKDRAGRFSEPIKLAPSQAAILPIPLMSDKKICFKIAKADKQPFALATLTPFGSGLATDAYTTCIAIYLQTNRLIRACPEYLKRFHTVRNSDGDWDIRPKPFFHDSAENRDRTPRIFMTTDAPRSSKTFEAIFRVHHTSFEALTTTGPEGEASEPCEHSTARPTITIY